MKLKVNDVVFDLTDNGVQTGTGNDNSSIAIFSLKSLPQEMSVNDIYNTFTGVQSYIVLNDGMEEMDRYNSYTILSSAALYPEQDNRAVITVRTKNYSERLAMIEEQQVLHDGAIDGLANEVDSLINS